MVSNAEAKRLRGRPFLSPARSYKKHRREGGERQPTGRAGFGGLDSDIIESPEILIVPVTEVHNRGSACPDEINTE